MAILLREHLGPRIDEWAPLVFGTDIDPCALATAERGVYPRGRLDHVKLTVFDRYFDPTGDRYRVRPSARAMVRFSRDDLVSRDRIAPAASVFGTFDLVLCRNVLIYFTHELQERVIEKLMRALAPGGFLVLGTSETLHRQAARELTACDHRTRIYRRG